MMRLCARSAIERAETETPHLQRGALDLYPNRLPTDRKCTQYFKGRDAEDYILARW